jgi:hypothetical protein
MAGLDQLDNTSPSTPEVNIVIAGRPGAGKSTLASNILGRKVKRKFSATSSTTECETEEETRHGVTVRVTDTVGLGDRKEKRKKELKKLHQHTRGHADLLVYCVPVNPGSRFDFGNPAIMKSLQSAYGKEIWKHCVVVFTFSNMLLNQLEGSKDEVEATYKSHLLEYATEFRKELVKLKVKDLNIKTVFGFEIDGTAEDPAIPGPGATPKDPAPTLAAANEPDHILAIPAGIEHEDKVFPDFKDPTKLRNPRTHEVHKINITDWTEILLIAMVRKCKNEPKNLLQYRYGKDFAKSFSRIGGGAVGGMAGGVIGGAAIGAGAGAILGLVGGPLGMGVGVMIGAVIGGTTGAVGGGVGGGIIGKAKK